MDSDSYLFRLSQYESNIMTTWQEIQSDKELCDLTLACDDMQQILAHKIVISANSSVFRNILKQISSSQPVIYLTGVKYEHLRILIDFIYQGEVNLSKDDLDPFLKLAEDLKLKGLLEESENYPMKICKKETASSPKKIYSPAKNIFMTTNVLEQNNTMDIASDNIFDDGDIENCQPKMNHVPQQNERSSHVRFEDKVVGAMDEVSDNVIEDDIFENYQNKVQPSPIKICSIETPSNDNIQQNENNFRVNVENKVSSNVKLEKSLIHVNDDKTLDSQDKAKKFTCEICDKQYSRPDKVRQHKASVHDGIRYSCNQCNASSFTRKDSLEQHVITQHEGERYPCDICAIPFRSPGNLRIHKASVHDKIIYACDLCNFKVAHKYKLVKHFKMVHKI